MTIRVFSIFLLAVIGLAACDGRPIVEAEAATAAAEPGDLVQDRFQIHESPIDHAGTVARLLEALDRRDVTVFAMVDHQAGAETVDYDIPASTLLIFGNPAAGSPLIAAEPLLGAELPLRALVFDKGETTFLALTGMGFLERHYRLDAQSQIIDRVSDTLDAIAAEVTSAQ